MRSALNLRSYLKINIVNNELASYLCTETFDLVSRAFQEAEESFFIYLGPKRNCSWKFSQVVSARTLEV